MSNYDKVHGRFMLEEKKCFSCGDLFEGGVDEERCEECQIKYDASPDDEYTGDL